MMSAFERLAERMDVFTQRKMGKPLSINGTEHIGTESHFLPDFGAVTGDGISYVIFTDGYQPRKDDVVIAAGMRYIVTRYQRFNGKWLIFVEDDCDDKRQRRSRS